MSQEIFRDIEGYEDYQVTSWGRVFNKKTGNFIKPEVHCKGYLRVDLFLDGKRKHMKVHRLVGQAFIPNPEGKPQINHIDGNNQNNSYTNLEWVTDEENKQQQKEMIARRLGYGTDQILEADPVSQGIHQRVRIPGQSH